MSSGRTLLITVAGTSTRFCQSLGRDVLKSIYAETPNGSTILGALLDQCHEWFDRFIVVGGYQFPALQTFLESRHDPRIDLVMNDRFHDWGSGWSLHLGLLKALEDPACESVVFAEGDLILDSESLHRIALSPQSVLTSNSEPILASVSVAFYSALDGGVRYIYDTAHRALRIDEPFTRIGNSGQVWKFTDLDRLRQVIASLEAEDLRGTNLVQVGAYFRNIKDDEYQVVHFKDWHNCNTVEDFRRAFRVGCL